MTAGTTLTERRYNKWLAFELASPPPNLYLPAVKL